MYTGMTRLSFCSDIASRSATSDRSIDIPVKMVHIINRGQRILARVWVKKGTRGRISAVMNAPRITATANAMVPSTVFFVRGQCRLPYCLPMILAYIS